MSFFLVEKFLYDHDDDVMARENKSFSLFYEKEKNDDDEWRSSIWRYDGKAPMYFGLCVDMMTDSSDLMEMS